jgi:hypothetical protein
MCTLADGCTRDEFFEAGLLVFIPFDIVSEVCLALLFISSDIQHSEMGLGLMHSSVQDLK